MPQGEPEFALSAVARMSEAAPLHLRHSGEEHPPAPATRDDGSRPRSEPLGLRVEWVDAARDIPLDVWRKCFPPPFEGLWLYEALEQSGLEEQFTFAYALVLRDETIVALAPVFTAVLPISLIAPDFVDKILRLGGRFLHHLRFQKTLFVGSPCSDEGRVGTLPGISLSDVAPVLQRALWERVRQIGAMNLVWKDFPEPSWPALRALTPTAGLCETVSYPGTCILDLSGGFDAYLQRLSGRRRHNLRKKLRLSREHTDLEVEIVERPDAALVDDIWRLFQNTYERATTKFEKLNRRFWELVCASAPCHVIVLRDRTTAKAVGFMLVIIEGRRAINKFLGIDYGLGDKAFLYFRLWEEFMRLAMRLGASGAQSGQTSYRAKLDIGHELVPLSNFFRYRSWVMHQIAAFVARRISWHSIDADLAEAIESRAWRNASAVKAQDSGDP
jgi:hypothetical protein